MVFSDDLHQPVLLKEVMQYLITDTNGLYIDATTGSGGYSCEILSKLGKDGRLISIDRDADALEIAAKRCPDERQRFVKARFSQIPTLISKNENVSGVVFDLGVSRMQIKDNDRGFSFLSTQRLDMRMDKDEPLSAWEVVNTYDQKRLEEIIRNYGEERQSHKIARAIVERRKRSAINTCIELSDCISKVVGRKGKTHPATKTFQAIRIEVNREMDEIKEGLKGTFEVLASKGRLCVVSYHSLEDRLVKSFFKDLHLGKRLLILTKKPLTPTLDEIRSNPSARSAKLRAGEKL